MPEDDYREDGHFEVAIGERFCVPRFCPHRGGRLDHGTVNAKRKTIVCPLHHSVFRLDTGERLAGPASSPLAVCKRDTPCR